jgi:hypothetical protein
MECGMDGRTAEGVANAIVVCLGPGAPLRSADY